MRTHIYRCFCVGLRLISGASAHNPIRKTLTQQTQQPAAQLYLAAQHYLAAQLYLAVRLVCSTGAPSLAMRRGTRLMLAQVLSFAQRVLPALQH